MKQERMEAHSKGDTNTMEKQQKSSLQIIQQANKEMLDYFNDVFLEDLENIQKLKTQTFEIDIKIDELEKTKNIYAFKSSSRKSVFSPTVSDDMETEKSKLIDEKINDLLSVREALYNKITALEQSISSVKKRLSVLNDAENAIIHISGTLPRERLSDTNIESDDDFEFVQEATNGDVSTHGYNILMHDAFEKTFYATLLDRNVKDGITNINHKLEMLSYLLSTDVNRAKITIKELSQHTKHILDTIDDISGKLDSKINSSQPIWNLMDEFVMQQRDSHPECIIDANIECTDYDINLHPVFTINLIKLLNIFFDNVFKHANANSINLRVCISKNKVEVCLTDNGTGINPDYLTISPWYSSLHKANEIIYLLNGNLHIDGNPENGTTIKFDFPVQG